MKEKIVLPASIDALYEAVLFVTGQMTDQGLGGCEAVELAVEEIFVNIVCYAYPEGQGEVEISCGLDGRDFVMTFADQGVPFDPTAYPKPDLEAPAGERPIGGLGIYLVCQYMDSVSYKREGSRNLLTVRKCMKER